MFIKQLSIFVENKTGRLQNIVDTLSENNINISALSIADTTEFGILRLIVNDSEAAKAALSEIGVISKITDVIAVCIDDRAGGLAEVLRVVSDFGIDVEYMYAFLGRKHGQALMVLKAADPEAAESALSKHGVTVAGPDDI
jgi:hypothetical protein